MESIEDTGLPRTILSRAWSLWGWEIYAQGQYERARQAFEAAIQLDAQNFRAYYGLGRYFLRIGQMEEAEKAFRRCLVLNPKASLGAEGMMLLERQRRRWLSAIKWFIRATIKALRHSDNAFF